jgi:hypothetical protein
MVAPRKYPEELREWTVRMVLDAEQDPLTRACVPSDRAAAGRQPGDATRLGHSG